MEHIRYISVLIRAIRVYPLFGSGSAMLRSRMQIKFFNSKTGNVKSEKGFTLVELIFVMTVTGILSSSLMLPFLNSMKQGTRSEIYATAVNTALEEVEESRLGGYTRVSGDLGPDISAKTLNGITYTQTSVREYVSYTGSGFVYSASSTDFIRVTETVSNDKNSDVISLWVLLPRDFYDEVANP
jgi:prepilin-type N-terminal cleavage/methylation domain-containing protein